MTIGLRTRLLFPLGVVVLFLGAYMLVFGDAAHLAPEWIIGLLLLLLAAMATNLEVTVVRPLRGLLQSTQDLVQWRAPAAPVDAPSGPMRELAADLDRLRGRMQEYETKLSDERLRRQGLEQSVRELEDRYALTVERANDGIWEWNVKSGAVEFSLRWKAMLGLSGAPLQRVDDWRALLHPDERDAVLQSLDNYLNGAAPRFDEQYRLRQGDGLYRWVQSRGTAIRHANGTPYRVIVMDNDIHARKQIENALIEAAEGSRRPPPPRGPGSARGPMPTTRRSRPG